MLCVSCRVFFDIVEFAMDGKRKIVQEENRLRSKKRRLIRKKRRLITQPKVDTCTSDESDPETLVGSSHIPQGTLRCI
jgi:hypothetical protein